MQKAYSCRVIACHATDLISSCSRFNVGVPRNASVVAECNTHYWRSNIVTLGLAQCTVRALLHATMTRLKDCSSMYITRCHTVIDSLSERIPCRCVC